MSSEEQDSYPLIPKEIEGCHEMYSSVSKFTEHLTGSADNLSSEKTREGLVFWMPQSNKNSNSDASRSRSVQEKIALALQKLEWPYLFVQFWAPKKVADWRYLTTLGQPFAVAYLIKGLCWYRKRSMEHEYIVGKEEHLGPPGRVFRNGINMESSPDLLLYSKEEFALRDHAASCGLRSYLALPVFDVGENKCIGVLEFLNFHDTIILPASEIQRIDCALKVADLGSIKRNTNTVEKLIYQQPQPWEVRQMLELAIKEVPQLHLAQVWVPCEQSANTSKNVYNMKRADFINDLDQETNSLVDVSKTLCEFVYTCEFQNLHSGQGIVGLAMSSTNKSCFCRNISDFSISEYPMAHYVQRARLSFTFAVCLMSNGVENMDDLYILEFFLQPQSRDDAYICSMLGLLMQIMEMELKSFKIANGRQLGEIIVADEICRKNGSPALESGQKSMSSVIFQYDAKKEHRLSKKNTMVVPMDGYNDKYTLSEFREYLQRSDWYCLQAPMKRGFGWICQSMKEVKQSKQGSDYDPKLHENIKILLSEILSTWTVEDNPNLLIQFWGHKMIENKPYLSTSDQPFALGCLSTGLCVCRKRCIEYLYYIGDGAKEEQLGPIGRAFLNLHPESSPDLRLYSNREFPLRDHFVHCDTRRYLALPLFDLHDQICIGVLEFFGCPFSFEDIIEKLEAANLRSIHISSWLKESCFAGKNIAEGQKVALSEINELIELVMKSPLLHLASVWIPCKECAHKDIKMSCFELVKFSNIDLLEFSDKRMHDLTKACKFLRLQPRKGIIGRMLESENKLSFCQHFCDFSIIEQPLAHYAQVARLEFCFAICLQSSHTANDVYILEFFPNHGHPLSFLCSLLSLMKQKLKSFKVASGQQLGRELISEAIEFCKSEEFCSLQSGHVGSLLVESETAQYGDKMEHHDSKNLAHITSDYFSTEGNTSKRDRHRFDINDEDLKPHIVKRLHVEEALGESKTEIKAVGRNPGTNRPSIKTVLKGADRYHGTNRWPSVKTVLKAAGRYPGTNRWPSNVMNITSPFETNTENKSIHKSDIQVGKVCLETDVVMIKARFKDDTIRFELHVSSGIKKLEEEVAKRLNLKIGSFRFWYLDKDDDTRVLLACDDDLHLLVKTLLSLGKTTAHFVVHSIGEELPLF